MSDDNLREIFASLSELAKLGPLPVQAYSMVAQRHSPEALAEHLHQRWMADARFGQVAANIVHHIHRTEEKGMALSSCVLALLLNDYRNRLEVRARSSLMFRNSVKTLFSMYPVYQQIDACVSKCFIKPMFNSLDMLIDNNPEKDDIETVGVLLAENGGRLNSLNSYRIDGLVVKVRRRLCEDGIPTDIRKILLHVNDLWAFGWNELLIPEALSMDYVERPPEDEPRPLRKFDIEKKEFGSKESIV